MSTISLADAKAHLSELIASAIQTHERTVITKNGKPVAALMSIEDLESLEETLAIMSDPELMASIRESEAEIERDEIAPITREDAQAMLAERRHSRRARMLGERGETLDDLGRQ